MATPGELITAVASVLGVPEATVFQFDRQLAEGGLRSKRGRGRSAARVTPRDASNLLIAVVASPAVKDAVRTCRTYASLPFNYKVGDDRKLFANAGLRCLAELPRKHTLSEALIALITGLAGGERYVVPAAPETLCPHFRITFFSPILLAHLVAEVSLKGTYYAHLTYGETVAIAGDSDLFQERAISMRTVRVLAELIRNEG